MTLPLISMRQITKRFPGVIANNKINLELYPGEIHALLGENGSGKSTLLRCLNKLETIKYFDEYPYRSLQAYRRLYHGWRGGSKVCFAC